ncbi:MAG: NAD(P)/FAD-dependent oxidoreductase [Chloroflexota bacterium]
MSSSTNFRPDYQTAIIGAGFGGLGMGIKLKMQGDDSFIIFERADELGGTWRDNNYPGCACDVPSSLYSFSFDQNPNWSKAFSNQPEILEYLKACAVKFNIREKIRFNSDVNHAEFDEHTGCWTIQCQDGFGITARFLISAMGPLNRPKIPHFPGIESFGGEIWHSAEWRHDVPLEGKRVASIGTGASAIQYIPEIAPDVRRLDVYQRSAPWVTPRNDAPRRPWVKRLFQRFPLFMNLHRSWIYWMLEMRVFWFLGKSEAIKKFAKSEALKHIEAGISDPELRQRVTPNYTIGCKRVLVSDDYYPALNRQNVELVTSPIQEIQPNCIIDADGNKRPTDIIILGTGFVASEFLTDMQVIGRGGRKLFDEWNSTGGPEAYAGIQVSGYPNLFFLLGPNTGLGHNSVVHIIESNYNYIFDYMRMVQEKNVPFLDIDPAAQADFNSDLQDKLDKTVWQSGGCTSWYQTDAGRNTTLWPGSTVAYRRLTRRVNQEAFQ